MIRETRAQLSYDEIKTGDRLVTLEHIPYIHSVKFSPDVTMITVGSALAVMLWDPSTKNYDTLKGYTRRVNSVKYSPDGTILHIRDKVQTT